MQRRIKPKDQWGYVSPMCVLPDLSPSEDDARAVEKRLETGCDL
jgi:hypothetical protein